MSSSDKDRYFSISDAVDDISCSSGAKETAVSGLKLIGKGLFNVAKYAVTEVLPAVIIKESETVLKRDDLTDEQREKAQVVRDRAFEYKNREK